MIRALFNPGNNATGRRVRRRPSSAPKQVSRRDFLTFGQGRRGANGTWRVTIDAGDCTDCAACTRICDESALRRSDRGSFVAYTLDTALCTGCGDCETVCAATALSVRQETEPEPGVVEIVRLRKEECARCGQRQAGMVDGVCPVCRLTESLKMLRR